jgi:hypothetical protein
MHELRINNTVIHFPGEWDELSRENLEAITGLAGMTLTEMQFKVHALCAFTGIQILKSIPARNPADPSEKLFRVHLSDSSLAMITSGQLTSAANCLDFLLRKDEEVKGHPSIHLESRLTKNLVPCLVIRGERYWGPADRLFNLSFTEFIHAETNLKLFLKSKEIPFLDRLIAILYRKEAQGYDPGSIDFKGDRREPFNDHLIDERAKRMSRCNHNLKMAVYLFYTGCQEWIRLQFPHVFSQTSKGDDNTLGFLGLVDSLTAGDVTKTELVLSSYLMSVMVHLERAAMEHEKMKADLKKK